MPEEDRNDPIKATNASLTGPQEDVQQQGNDYPPLPHGREQVRTGSPEHIADPTYAAPPGQNINPDVDPAAPHITAQPGQVANDLDEGANPHAGQPGTERTAEDIAPETAREFPGVENLAPGAASMEHARPDSAPIGRHTQPVESGDPNSAPNVKSVPDADLPPPFKADAKDVRGAAVDVEGGETIPHGRTRAEAEGNKDQGR